VSEARFQCAADVLTSWREDVLSGTAPTLYPIGPGELQRVEIGPGLVLLLGGAPGSGKTAFTMQAVIDALRLTPPLRAAVCNVEMPPAVLLDRQLARLSGIDVSIIRHRRLTSVHADRIDQALATLEPLADRLAFVRPPFTLENIALTADAFEAGFLLLDYIQRIPPPGDHVDKRGSVNATMDHLRRFADAGTAVIVVSAIGRTKDRKGRSSYAGEGLSLASFRESSELEYGCDDALLLLPGDDPDEPIVLRHLKSRHGEVKDLELTFDAKLQRFAPTGDTTPKPERGKLKSDLRDLWNQTKPADEGTGGDGE
jgi:replicative DNA helicase